MGTLMGERRCVRLAMPIAVAMAVGGCAGSARQLEVGRPAALEAGEGLLAVVVDARVTAIDFCGPDYALPCFRVGPFGGETAMRLVAVDAGTYCITRMSVYATSGSADVSEPDPPAPCVTVTAGAVTYPGDLVVSVQAGPMLASTGQLGVRQDEARVTETIARDYPDVAQRGWAVQVSSWEMPPAAP